MKRILDRFLNPEVPLRLRLFQLLSAIALAEFVIVSVYQVVQGSNLLHIGIMLFGTLFFAATVAFTFRSGHVRAGATVSGLLYFAIYPLTFFSSGGMYGGAPVVFAFALVYVFLITEKWERVMALAICIMTSGICYLLAWRHPEMLTRHSVSAEHVESFLAILLVTLLLCTLFLFVTRVYREENKIVQRQKKEIEDLSQVQKRFFSSMSHEIRTPVNAIIGLNEMTLREKSISDEVRENAQNIEVAGKTLLQTINEVMDMSRLETGTMQIVEDDYRSTAVLSDIVGMIWLRAQEKGLEFSVRVDPQLPSVLHGDEVRIRQILLNVITNAVKYTKEGSVTLAVSGKTEDNGDFSLVFDVSDTGIGIREESIPYLFSAFQRVDEQNVHKIEGTGLGLSIVRQLLDLMNGSVTVASEYGTGSCFHIEIPQTVVNAAPVGEVDVTRSRAVAAPAEQPPSAVPDMRVLAVDDTPMNLMVVKKLLRDTGVTLETAASGAEALQKTALTHFDVILMDHQMPEMDGIECLHRIREQEDGKCRDSKIVCLTANVGAEMQTVYRQEGFDGYLMKPVKGRVLEDELARLAVSCAAAGRCCR